jgi:hypothetical protein
MIKNFILNHAVLKAFGQSTPNLHTCQPIKILRREKEGPITENLLMNSFKNETFEEWTGWKLQYILPCQEGTNGEGEKTFFNALLACAQRYPERIREWAEMVNEARCQPRFTPFETEHKVRDVLRIVESAALTGGAKYIQNTKKPYKQPTNKSSQNGYHLLSEVIKDVMPKITFDWLWWRSPIVPNSQSAASFLARLYERE